MDLDHEIARLAEPQFGNFTHAQARAVGFGPAEIKWRLKTGRWIRRHDIVFRIAGAPPTWKAELLAGCWAGGARAVASHRSAAALWGFAGGSTNFVEITCPRWRRAQHADIVVHESKAITAGEIGEVDGIPVTSPELTLLMLGAVSPAAVVEMGLERGLRQNLFTFDSTQSLLDRAGRRGRNGAGVLREVMGVRNPSQAPTESEMETLLLRALRKNGLPAPVPQYNVYNAGRFVARVDCAYVNAKVAIEYESIEHYTGRRALIRDNPRRNALVAVKWKPLGAVYDDLRAGGAVLCQTILDCVNGDLALLASTEVV